MKKLILLTLLISSAAWAAQTDSETLEYCKHKYEQVTLDVAMEDLGCKFSEETKKHIIQNRNNTYQNCAPYLDEKTRNHIGKSSLTGAKVLIKKFGLNEACEYNTSLYPEQIYN
ncbi:hypothetical protein J1C14_001792 [Acinetobacter baumannii]|nr:hypothetical protein [Acinetobacter baumannii]